MPSAAVCLITASDAESGKMQTWWCGDDVTRITRCMHVFKHFGWVWASVGWSGVSGESRLGNSTAASTRTHRLAPVSASGPQREAAASKMLVSSPPHHIAKPDGRSVQGYNPRLRRTPLLLRPPGDQRLGGRRTSQRTARRRCPWIIYSDPRSEHRSLCSVWHWLCTAPRYLNVCVWKEQRNIVAAHYFVIYHHNRASCVDLRNRELLNALVTDHVYWYIGPLSLRLSRSGGREAGGSPGGPSTRNKMWVRAVQSNVSAFTAVCKASTYHQVSVGDRTVRQQHHLDTKFESSVHSITLKNPTTCGR